MDDSAKPLPTQRKSPLLIFVHIPKTAGTTLGSLIARQYNVDNIFFCHPERSVTGKTPEDFQLLPLEDRLKYKVISGHLSFGLHERLDDPCTYIAVLRDPVDRAISHYYYVRKRKDHYLHDKVMSENLTLEEYVTKGVTLEMDNGQTRMLVGDMGYATPFGECPPEFLEQAKRNIREKFAVIGTSERFDETLLVAKKVLGWSMPLYISWKVTRDRPKRQEISPEVAEAIRQQNTLDIELYQYVDELLDEMLAKHVKFLGLKLAWFRFLNRLYVKFHDFAVTLPGPIHRYLAKHFFKLQ